MGLYPFLIQHPLIPTRMRYKKRIRCPVMGLYPYSYTASSDSYKDAI